METVMAIGVLSMTSMCGISAFFLLNRYAANNRNLSEARALCQERIEQALTLPFRPTNSVVPLAPSSDPSSTATIAILGPATSYNTTTGAYTGGTNVQTSSENIPVYTQSEGTAANNSATVTYTRTTSVTQAPLTNTTATSTSTTSLYIMQFTVSVSYVFLGKTYTTTMCCLRSPD